MQLNIQKNAESKSFLIPKGYKSYILYKSIWKLRKALIYSFIMLLVAPVIGCDKDDVNPRENLPGKCLQAKLITPWRCTSAVFVQLLNFNTGTTSFYDGKEYENVILLSNLPDSLNLGADNSKPFFFTIDTSTDFESCTKFYPCTQVILGPLEPSPVTIKVCGNSFSITDCPTAE